MRATLMTAASLMVLSGCAMTGTNSGLVAGPNPYEAIVKAPDRTDADKQLDPGRKPAAFLAALDVKPGMKVGELLAGGGYTTELLARAVAPNGTVYGENPQAFLDRAGDKWKDRLAREPNKSVVREDRPLDDPFPAELAGTLDLVVTNANYHDALAFKVDVKKMNAAVFASLKSGGRYVICDSSAVAGSGLDVASSLHRIDENLVKDQVRDVGFKFDHASDVLRNPADTRDWNASPGAAGDKRGTSDRFILVFVKP